MNGFANSLVCSATADIPSHEVVNVGVRRIGFLCQQRYSGHDLPGLAVTALGYVFFHPGYLNRVRGIGGKALNRRDVLSGNAGDVSKSAFHLGWRSA